ncbi:unnamed protein product [Linum trigynum]|uniref:Uncharacterized protein n=1 Tax=Linum trigynum TaxID=586398 RepID=A0AAV2DSB0_9ROSI
MEGNSITNEARLFLSSSNQVAYGLKLAHQIEAIRSKLVDIAKQREQFEFEDRALEPVVAIRNWRQTDYSVPGAVVGRE